MDLSGNEQMTLALLAVVGATYILYRMLRRPPDQDYPPGPSTLPFLGNLHQVVLCERSITKFLEKYRRMFGNVYTIEFGGVKKVVISGYDAMYELFQKNADCTSTRTTLSLPENYTESAKTNPGIFFAEYPHWKTIRSFALNQLREEGMGKSSLEPRIMEEFHLYLHHFISPCLGEPVDLSESLNLATANVISLLLFGTRQEYTDEKFLAWKNAFDASAAADVKAAIFQNIPLVKYLPGDPAGLKANIEIGKFVLENSAAWVEDRKRTLDPDNPAGFLDNFLIHANKLREQGEDISCFTDGNAAKTCMQMYAAGLESTSIVLRWALLYMAVYPDIQEKVKTEIHQAIGDREPAYKDRLNLPYTVAVIEEVFRRSNIAPTTLPRKLDKELVVQGKVIPTGSELMFNMTSVLHDESVFEEPDLFKPERFLTGDVELKKRHNIPFGMGRRVCLGRDLAKMELFLFFISFLQRFDVTYSGDTAPSVEIMAAMANEPMPHKLVFSHR